VESLGGQGQVGTFSQEVITLASKGRPPMLTLASRIGMGVVPGSCRYPR
jgi:hypothetical protein